MSRGLTYWNDENIQFIREHFVAVSVPTWVCRVQGPEGEFLRAAGIHKHWVTSSGYMSCVSASGKLLGGRPSAEVLEKFQQLPEDERRPGAVQVRDLSAEEQVIPAPPEGGLVLRVHARFLTRDGGKLRHAETTDFPLMREKPEVMRLWQLFLQPNTEYMWLTREEWQALVPAEPTVGQQVAVPPIVAQRLARFHLTPQRATTSEGGIVDKRNVKRAEMELAVREVTKDSVDMVLRGFVHWGSDYDESKATTPDGPLPQGYEAPLYGRLVYDPAAKKFVRFDLVAPGDVWGRWGDANGKSMYVERPGRNPFGFALELADFKSPTDRIPPGGNGHYLRRDYFAAEP